MNDESDDLSFVVAFPLPFRVLFLAGIGILGWAANLHGLHLLGIDTVSALDLHPHDDYDSHPSLPLDRRNGGLKLVSDASFLYTPVYRTTFSYGVCCLSAWAVYRYATHGSSFLVDPFKFIPAICALGVLMVLLCPYNVFQKRERDAFLLAIRRCLFSPINHPIYFSDVVFADIFTSYAKVLGDVWLSLCMLLPGGSLLSLPEQDGWQRWILPSLMSFPYLVRLRQCLIEYGSPTNTSRRPLFNALKYASSFPVIFLSAAQRIVVLDLVKEKGEHVANEPWHGEHAVFRLWLLCAFINSVYSFWWDVTNDWGFDLLRFNRPPKPRPNSLHRPLVLPALHDRSESVTTSTSLSNSNSATPLFSSSRHSPRPASPPRATQARPYPYGLRSTLLYPLPFYPLIIFLDLVLRLTWGIKLSSHLHAHRQSEGSFLIFWIEVAELLRRWLWVFVRVEWEVLKRAQEAGEGRQYSLNFDQDGNPGAFED
ncbi:EXS-domain-containing protein [Auriscalpium vulgare]|uniref:EXS-domain-containing protein n=1 Tax=Auriscalpium vulgare TaxID=40419 RepID=A0ACB8RDA0_9AGAM|nr:EXS-domain-containing protein [Auriscalpium vulgare]